MTLKLLLLLLSVSLCFTAPEEQGQVISIEPREVIKRVGDNFTVLCKVNYPIDSCRISLGPAQTTLRVIPKVTNANDIVTYFGSGLEAGECGGLIRNVTEDLNGPITCHLPPKPGHGQVEIKATMMLIVAKEPEFPKLTLSKDVKEGALYNATCEVKGGRPAAKITWLYDGQDLRNLPHKFTITNNNAPVKTLKTKGGKTKSTGTQKATEPAVYQDENKGASETVTWTASADDDGKKLTCSASHESWDKQQTSSTELAVIYKPIIYVDGKKIIKAEFKKQGLKLGESNTITITVMSRSEPTNVEWTIGKNKTLKPDGSSVGNFKAAQEKDKKNKNFYINKLTISNLTAEEMEQTYTFKVTSNEGTVSKSFTLSIEAPTTTKPKQPPVAEAHFTLMIILVVVGFLLLVIIAIVVFAKLKHKMCFASKPPVHTGQVVQPE